MTADPGTELIDPVLAERARAAYRARDVLFGMEADVDDILIVADWLLTGTADLALRYVQQRADNYEQRVGPVGADAATWSPTDVDD